MNARASAASRPTIILAAIAALALSLMYLVRPAYAGEPATLNPAHVGTDSSQTADGADCKDGDAPAGMVLWHFILNDVTPGIDDPIPGHFDFHDSGTQDVDSSQWNPGGGTHHFYVFTTGDDVLDGATADIGDSTYNNFNLSHICHGDEVDQSVEESVEESVAESVEESVGESVGESVNESVAESGEQSLEAGEGTPEESQSDTSMGLGGSNPLPTIAFGLILLASLTGLAFVNVKAARSR